MAKLEPPTDAFAPPGCRPCRVTWRRLEQGQREVNPPVGGSGVVGPKADIPSPEQLVAVRIPLSPFQDPDRCDTMCCLVLTRPMRRREFIASMGGSAVSRAVRAQQSPQEYALM